jgi:hypothetical protein
MPSPLNTEIDETQAVRELLHWIAERVIDHRATSLDSTHGYLETLLPTVIATLRKTYVAELNKQIKDGTE